MAKRTSAGNPALNRTAENVGAVLGRVAARLGALKKGASAGGGRTTASGKGAPKAARAPAALKDVSRKASNRHNATDGGHEHPKPQDQRANIRSKAPRTWSNRQPGRG